MPKLTSVQPVDGAHAAIDIAADPSTWLPTDSRPAGPDRWLVPLRAAGLNRTVRCELGPPVERPRGTWRTVTWKPVPEPGRIARASGVRLLADIVSSSGQTTRPLTAAGRTRIQ